MIAAGMLENALLSLQAALLQADGGKLTTEMLNPLLRAVPEQKEIADIQLYLRVCYTCHLVTPHLCMLLVKSWNCSHHNTLVYPYGQHLHPEWLPFVECCLS